MNLSRWVGLLSLVFACDESCFSCVGNAANECISCGSDAHLVPAHGAYIGSCVCNSGFCARPDAMHCASGCDPSCSTCSGCGSKQCTGCADARATLGKLASGECKCDTTANWCVGPDASGMCQAGCDKEGCLACSKCSKCDSCAPNAELDHGGKNCKCSPGKIAMFDSGNCVSSCGANMVRGKTCTCVSGFYPKADHTCGTCHSLCQTCVGPGAKDCKSCLYSSAQISGDPGPCTCIHRYFPNPDANSCSLCDPACDYCSGPGTSNCYSCPAGLVLSGPAPSNCFCLINQFWNGSICVICDVHCDICTTTGPGNCLTCVDPNASTATLPGTCVCVDGYFEVLNRCEPCFPTCKTCNGSAVSDCLTCFSNAAKVSGVCACDSGYWPDNSPADCKICDISCQTCSNGISCDSCIPHAATSGGLCTCLDHYYFDVGLSLCNDCYPSCFTCTDLNPADCLSCYSNASISLGTCICDPGYYEAFPGSCQLCASSCLTCSQSGPNMCLSCFDFAELTGPSPSSCSCTQGAFPNPDVQHCSLCVSPCQTCTQATVSSCISCYPGAILTAAVPSSCECLQGYFPSPDTSSCAKCEEMCQTCSSSNVCISCQSNAELQIDSSCMCKEGYYGAGWDCLKCSEGCLLCNEAWCEKCSEHWYLLNNQCVTVCPPGYIAKNLTCEQGDLTPPEPYMTVNNDNSLIISFSKPMHMNLASLDIFITVTDTSDFSYSLVWSEPIVLDQSSFLLNLTIDSPYLPDDNLCVLTFLHPDTVVDLMGVALVKSELLGVLYDYGNTQASTSAAANATVKANAAAVAQGSVGAVATVSLLNGNPASFWSLLNQLQLITYIPMTTMPVPSKLLTTLGALNVGTFVPNPFSYILPTNESSQRPPSYAQRYEVESSLFLLNAGLMMSTALALLLGFIPIFLLSQLSSGFLIQYLRRLLPAFKWGIPLRWWIQSYLDISIYSLLQVQQVLTNNGLSAVAVSLNFIISLGFAGFALITPIIFYIFIWRNYAKMTQRDDQTFNKHWGVLYLEFSQSRSIDGLLYYPLFLTRRLTYALTIVFLSSFPKTQAVINTSMALAVPFK